MQAKDFTSWRDRMGYNRSQAAEALGISRNMPQKYEEGDTEIPRYIELACDALETGERKLYVLRLKRDGQWGHPWSIWARSVTAAVVRMEPLTEDANELEIREVPASLGNFLGHKVKYGAAVMEQREYDWDNRVLE